MEYRVQIDVAFADEKDAKDLMNYIEGIKDKAYKPKGTEKILCSRTARYHPCSHSEQMPTPCGSYVNVEFDKEKKTH